MENFKREFRKRTQLCIYSRSWKCWLQMIFKFFIFVKNELYKIGTHILWIKFHYLVCHVPDFYYIPAKTKQNKTKKHLAIANVQELHLAAIQANFRYLGSHIIGLLVQPHASQPNPCASALLSENKQLLRLKSCGKF